MPSHAEAGVRRNETYFARENLNSRAEPETPSDPQFRLYSSVVNTTELEGSAEFDARTGIGNVNPVKKNRQQETHELTIEYDLERFPVDTNGNPVDAFADAALRDDDNRVQNTHSFLNIEEKGPLIVENTLHYRYFEEANNTHPSGTRPSASRLDTRIESYARGCVPSEASLSISPGDSSVATVEMQYTAHKLRRYQIDQPEGEYIHIRSTAQADTSVSVSLETVDGGTSSTLSTDSGDGRTTVASSTTFDSLRVEVPDAHEGTIEVYGDDGSGSGSAGNPHQLLTVIRGSNTYDTIEADHGVPLIGNGSWEDESVFGAGIPALGSDLQWLGHPGGENVSSSTITVSNELAENNTDSGLTRDIRAGTQEITVESTVFGETESPEKYADHLEGREGALNYDLKGGTVDIPRAFISEGGSTEREAGNAVMQVDVTWRAMKPSDGGNALRFTPTS